MHVMAQAPLCLSLVRGQRGEMTCSSLPTPSGRTHKLWQAGLEDLAGLANSWKEMVGEEVVGHEVGVGGGL